MRCPNCGNNDDKVIESRSLGEGEIIRRRGECLQRGYGFTSHEKLEEKPFMVVTRDGSREPLGREKLEKGIQRALEKRPVATSMIEIIVSEIEDQAFMQGRISREITTAELGELVLTRLNTVDKVAYIRFASVYKHFENLDEFIKEVKKLGGDNNE